MFVARYFQINILYALNGCLVVIIIKKMATGIGNYQLIEAEDLLA